MKLTISYFSVIMLSILQANRPHMDVDLLHEEMSVLDSVDDFSDTHSQCSTMSQDPDTSRTHLSIGTISGAGGSHKSLFRDKS